MTGTIDFSAVILAHINWKKRFTAHVEGRERLDPVVVGKDNVCELGKWIESNPQLKAVPEYADLKRRHTEFHQVAAATLKRSAGLPLSEAQQLVGHASEYSLASAECVNAIGHLRNALAQHK